MPILLLLLSVSYSKIDRLIVGAVMLSVLILLVVVLVVIVFVGDVINSRGGLIVLVYCIFAFVRSQVNLFDLSSKTLHADF